MIDCYLIGMIAIAVLLFAVGLGLMIRGIRRYEFHILTILVPFFGALFCFPVYYALKESYLKKSGAQAADVKCAHRLTVLSFIFLGAFLIVTFGAGVSSFVGAFDAVQALDAAGAAGTEEAVMSAALKATWPARLFWGMTAVCVAYAVALPVLGCCKKK